MVAFCQVSSTAGSKQADGRRAGSGGRVPEAAVEPQFRTGGRADQPDPASPADRRGKQAGAVESTGAESRALLPATAPESRPAAGCGGGSCGLQLGGRTRAQRRGGAGTGRCHRPGNSAHRTKERGLRAAGLPSDPSAGQGYGARWGPGSLRHHLCPAPFAPHAPPGRSLRPLQG